MSRNLIGLATDYLESIFKKRFIKLLQRSKKVGKHIANQEKSGQKLM